MLTGCGDAALGPVAVYRTAPDTLVIAVAPGRSLFTAAPETLALTVSDARGFVLAERRVRAAAAPAWAISVADARVPSRGRLMVEVCGRVRRRLVCEQEPVAATPKRLRTTAHLAYPAGGDRERVVARAVTSFERLERGVWKPLPTPPGLSYALSAWVEGAERDGVQVPLRPGRDTVALTAGVGYDAYWIRLNERVFYGEGARVYLRVTARWEGGQAAVADVVRRVTPPNQAARDRTVVAFARQAARALSRMPGFVPDSASARVASWRFDRIRQRYEALLTIALQDTLGRAVALRGKLLAGEMGQEASFQEQPLDTSGTPYVVRLGRLKSTSR